MIKYLVSIILLVILNVTPLLSGDFVNKYGINLGLTTFRLFNNNVATDRQFQNSGPATSTTGGGGLRYIEPGIDMSATFFFDSAIRHRAVVGAEAIFMNAKEINSYGSVAYWYMHHKVQFADIYAGYHFAFYEAPFQEVKAIIGAEVMFSNMFTNEVTAGLKKLKESSVIVSEYEQTYSKDAATRIGGRIRLGFEGRVYEKLYVNAGFNIGIYNLLLRDDTNGELFNRPDNIASKQESFQPFFNYNITFQWRM
jgi:hypothetical protein